MSRSPVHTVPSSTVGLVALAVLLSSCQAVGRYAERRLADLADCVAFEVAPGTGHPLSLAVGVELTEHAPLGLGFAEGRAYGLVGRHVGQSDYELANASLFALLLEDALEELGGDDAEVEVLDRPESVVRHRPRKLRGANRDRAWRVGAHAGVSVLFVYADVELAELLDFLAGLFGFDPLGDDRPDSCEAKAEERVAPEPESSSDATRAGSRPASPARTGGAGRGSP